jgi:hypothetical protein
LTDPETHGGMTEVQLVSHRSEHPQLGKRQLIHAHQA